MGTPEVEEFRTDEIIREQSIKINELKEKIKLMKLDKIKIKEVYEKYKHLDYLLTDEKWLGQELSGQILVELWKVVKEEAKKEVK